MIDAATVADGFTPAAPAWRATSLRCQRPRSDPWLPRALATWRDEGPSTVTSRTASALNSSVNARRILAIHHLRSDHTELAEVSARAGEDHFPGCSGDRTSNCSLKCLAIRT